MSAYSGGSFTAAEIAEGLASTQRSISEGDYVQWPGGTGVIEHLMLNGVLGTPGSPFAIEASEDQPAALIRIYRSGKATELLIGKRLSELNKSGSIGI